MQRAALLLAFLCIPLTSCVEQTLQRQIDAFTPNMSAFNPTTKEMHGIRLSVRSCSLNNRIIACSMTATSKHQDRTLNLLGGHYTKIQDDTGISYPAFIAFGPDAKDKTQRSAKLIADTPYQFSLQAENISTQATKVRAIDISRMDVTGTGAVGYIKMTFPNPPMRAITHHQQAKAVPAPHVIQKAVPMPVMKQSGGEMSYSYMFARIAPINEHIPMEPGIKALWGQGAYLHLSPNGKLGHNWSKPGTYAYVPDQTWKKNGNKLTILFGSAVTYTFDLSENTSPMVTYLDQGGAFKMTAQRKGKGQK